MSGTKPCAGVLISPVEVTIYCSSCKTKEAVVDPQKVCLPCSSAANVKCKKVSVCYDAQKKRIKCPHAAGKAKRKAAAASSNTLPSYYTKQTFENCVCTKQARPTTTTRAAKSTTTTLSAYARAHVTSAKPKPKSNATPQHTVRAKAVHNSDTRGLQVGQMVIAARQKAHAHWHLARVHRADPSTGSYLVDFKGHDGKWNLEALVQSSGIRQITATTKRLVGAAVATQLTTSLAPIAEAKGEIAHMSIKQLRAALAQRKQPTTGSRSALRSRLRDALDNEKAKRWAIAATKRAQQLKAKADASEKSRKAQLQKSADVKRAKAKAQAAAVMKARTRAATALVVLKSVVIAQFQKTGNVKCPGGAVPATPFEYNEQLQLCNMARSNATAAAPLALGARTSAQCSDDSLCVHCSPGRWAKPGEKECGWNSTQICPAGKFAHVDQRDTRKDIAKSHHECLPCPHGKYAAKGDDSCTSCAKGFVTHFHGATSVDDCVKFSCPAGKFKAQSSILHRIGCYHCPSGRYGTLSAAPKVLAAHGLPVRERRAVCMDCPTGKYNKKYGQTMCKAQYPAAKPAVAVTTAAMKAMPSNSTCPAGSFSAVTTVLRKKRCSPCPPGKFRAHLATVGCQNCESGRFQPVYGQSRCVQQSKTIKKVLNTTGKALSTTSASYGKKLANLMRLVSPNAVGGVLS